ncbi:MAG: TonB-dependent receptor [Bacteroidaceae bacterium]|nr:TonB-dependent receptor [Bacteroidaceae bacterium]
MNCRRLVMLLLLICSISAWAQTYQVNGRITASDTREPLPQVSVQLLGTDSVRVAIAATDEKGNFTLKAKGAGQYIVMARMIGFAPFVRNVNLTAERPSATMNFGMKPSAKELDEVSVTALSRMMTMKKDTLIFSSAALRLPPNASLAALMNQLPGIGIDKDGNMTYQGKVVNQILVDGKPFFGDVNTALANMPTDAVQNVKIYEKTDEEKEYRKELDTDKATVVDLTIKKEYKSKWMANVDLGGGTDKRYVGKIFATNFTDRRRTAVYAQMNNICQNQRVDANGNWSYWSDGRFGLFDYRKAGMIMQWDNDKANKEAGNLRGNANIDVYHNNMFYNTLNNSENFLGGGNTQYTYAKNITDNRDAGVDARANITYNIDSINRLSFKARYGYQNGRSDKEGTSSTFHTQPEELEDMAGSLVGDDVLLALMGQGINSLDANGNSKSNRHNANFSAEYTHLFKKQGRTLSVNAWGSINDLHGSGNARQFYRYFSPNAPAPELDNRQANERNATSYNLSAGMSYAEPINKYLRFSANYGFSHKKANEDYGLYDVYTIPENLRPTPGDSLQYVSDLQNTYYSDSYTNQHRLLVWLQGTWDKVESAIYPSLNLFTDYLHYDRNGEQYNPSRTHFGLGMYGFVKYKFTQQNYIQLSYNGSSARPSLLELLPIRDTSNPMAETVNNPDLKAGWSNSVSLYSRFFKPKRGDSYTVNAGFSNRTNSVVTTQETDPTTGYTRYGKTNVNGNYNMWLSAYTDQPLDTARHWNLNARVYANYSHNIGYVGAMGNSLGLSSVDSYGASANIGLRYRKDIWSVSLSAMYQGDFTRYGETPQYNQNGHTYEVNLSPQVDLPFGMKINTQFIYYARSGYADPLMNHPQWILNASISQSFLKSKALTIQLEGTDLLKSRTAESSHLSPTSRTYSRTDTFLSYVMLHAIYRFSL